MDSGPLAALVAVAACAGWVDAIAGGGGLLQVPALFVAGVPTPPLFGVNKTSSISGTTAALIRYARHGSVRWDVVRIAGPIAFVGSVAGTFGLLAFAKHAADAVRPVFSVLFLALAIHQAWRALRTPGHVPGGSAARPLLAASWVTAVGAYDGLVGPGTGIFLFWIFTTWWALGPLEATGTAKAVNLLTNAASLATLIARGQTIWVIALSMGAANLLGGWLGAHTAIRRGVRFIRLLTAAVAAGAAMYLGLPWLLSAGAD